MRQPARRVRGRGMRGELERPDAHDFAILQHAVHLHRRIDDAVAEMQVVLTAAFEQFSPAPGAKLWDVLSGCDGDEQPTSLRRQETCMPPGARTPV